MQAPATQRPQHGAPPHGEQLVVLEPLLELLPTVLTLLPLLPPVLVFPPLLLLLEPPLLEVQLMSRGSLQTPAQQLPAQQSVEVAHAIPAG
jgi:hypothetical protein